MTRARAGGAGVVSADLRSAPRWWPAARWTAWAAAATALGLAILLAPAVSERWLSADGRFEQSTRTLVRNLQMALVAAGLLLAGLGRFLRDHTRQKERLVLGGAFALGSVVVSIAVCEAGLRAASRVRPLSAERHFFFLHDQLLGWKHRPGAVARFKDAVVRINSRGLRDNEVAPAAAPSELRVLVLGDSQVFGDGVEADDTFVQELERQVPGVDAINAGVIGYGTDQQLLYYEREGVTLSPKLVIVGLNAYDLRDNLSNRVRSGYLKPRFELAGGQLSLVNVPVSEGSIVDRLQRRLRSQSYLYTFLSGGGRGRRTRAEANRGREALDIYPSDSQMDRALAVTQQLLCRLATRVHQHGGRLLVTFLPYEMDFSADATYRARSDRLLQSIQDAGLREGFVTWDLRRDLNPDRRLYLDTMHFNSEGHRQVAAALKKLVHDEGMIPGEHAR